MNICKELYDDYFNNNTTYVNLHENHFFVYCNQIQCNKNMLSTFSIGNFQMPSSVKMSTYISSY